MKKILLMTIVALMATGCSCSKKTEQTEQVKPQDRITILHVNDFEELVHKGEVRVIDVRTRSEYAEAHIAGAENVDVNQCGCLLPYRQAQPEGSPDDCRARL